ncbi:MAG: S9 family peptidase, partial [Candidatus Neomarinimicrobiota bacterium]
GVVDLTGDETRWMDHGQGDRAVSFSSPVWSDDGEHLIAWAGAVDHKDAWLQLLDLETGGTRTIVHEHDDAWVRGFRTGRLARGDGPAYGWMPDDERVYFLSERDGYFHLYVTGLDGGDPTQLTSGRFGLVDLRLSKDDERWYFISNEVHPAENQLYTMPLEGGARTRLTTESGWYTYQLSPDEIHVALTYSNATQPRELFVMPTRAGAALTQLFTATKAEFHRHDWRESEIVTFDDGEGHTIYADVWVPDRPLPGRPAIIRVHGAGWAQGVSRRWTNTLPFLHYLAQEGYIVLNLDYRGSRGYGRDFRTGIYRHMGETEVRSGLAAVEYLVTEQGVDRERIGLFGGSYGGFFTLMSMFKHPGVFKAGAVRAPVTDWAHYNHGYTTRILNAPYDDTEAYERSSPIYLAEGLEDHLLIQHGVQDGNVHFQDSVRLAQRLLELRKKNWEIMIYPVEAHSLQNEDYNRYDVMRRRVDLFNRVLRAPAKPQRSGPDAR